MPDQASTRYENHDAPVFIAEMAKLCPDCKVIYQNADADIAQQQQQQQFNAAIAQGTKVIVLDPVDSNAAASLVGTAKSQCVKVIANYRQYPLPTAQADFCVSFANQGIADSLVAHLKVWNVPAGGATGVLQINGSPTDAAAGLIK
jgi:D-xylose transport system substrate-binding protein